jgi:hypothetical protein
MEHLDEIEEIKNSFILIDNLIRNRLLKMGDIELKTKLEISARRNSIGHFIMLFSLFENWVEMEYRDLIGNPMEVYFMERIDQILTSKSHKIIIDRYYTTRCAIAHGRAKKVQNIDVLAVAKNLAGIIEKGVG